MARSNRFVEKYSAALVPIIGRELQPTDRLASGFEAAEHKHNLKIPAALCDSCLIAGRLPLNKEHNGLHSPEELEILAGKLVFMEENQCVVFWGMDLEVLGQDDPEVFQAKHETPFVGYPEELPFSDFILKMWRWQYGLDPGN